MSHGASQKRPWLARPELTEREQRRLLSTVRAISLVLGVVAIAAVALEVLVFHNRGRAAGTALALMSLATAIVCARTAQRGHAWSAALILVGLAWSLTTAAIVLAGGLETPGFSAYLLVIVIAGQLLGARAALVVALMSGVASAGIAFLGESGSLPWRLIAYGGIWELWGVEMVLVVGTASLMFFSLNRTDEMFRDVQGSEMTLERRNRELEESREQYRALTENVSDLIAEFDSDGVCRYVTPNLRNMLGFEPEEVVGTHYSEWVRADEGRAVEAHVDPAGAFVGRAWRQTMRIRHRDGSLRTFETAFSVFRDASGNDRLASISRDVSDRMRAEETETLLRAAMDQAGDSILVLDPEQRIIYANRAFEGLSGVPREELLGSSANDLLSGFDPEVGADIVRTLAAGRVWRGQIRPHLLDGTRPIREVTFAPVRADGDSAQLTIAVVRDVTRETQLEAELREAQKMEALGQLAGGIAHDFNNLLLVITGYAHLVSERFHGDAEGLELVTQIREAADRAAELTGQLLAFGRRQLIRSRVVDLNEVVEQSGGMLSRVVPDNVEVSLQLAPDLRCVRVDPSQIQQVLLNLAANARDAMPDGGRIEIATFNSNAAVSRGADIEPAAEAGENYTERAVVLLVRDTGSGMDAATRERIFEPFFTTKEVGKGTGLGLSSVYGTVEQWGGSISVKSTPGEGTCFRIELPGTDEAPGPRMEPTRKEEGGSVDATVLLVEDQAGVRKLMRRVLQGEGYRILEAGDGVEAMDLVRDRVEPIDALVTDVMMPNMDGPALARELIARWPDLRVIYSSGYPQEDVALAGTDDPRSDYLPKPFDPDDLATRLRTLLARKVE